MLLNIFCSGAKFQLKFRHLLMDVNRNQNENMARAPTRQALRARPEKSNLRP